MLHRYWFWLILVSAIPLTLERIRPWRTDQRLLRPELRQDLFWLLFNGYLLGLVAGPLLAWIFRTADAGFALVAGGPASSYKAISEQALWIQIPVLLVAADFLEWCVHNLLHRVSFLWSFHRLHHSITTMDWMGNFRFHWMEILVYKTLKYLPLTVLNADWQAVLAVAVISTLIGNLNHSNLRITWGLLRYILNSPCMHLWHHDKFPHRRAGCNFAIVFSLWDWLFGTAWMPEDEVPKELGFRRDGKFPPDLLRRFLVPFLDVRPTASPAE